jgi:hypothetical protein
MRGRRRQWLVRLARIERATSDFLISAGNSGCFPENDLAHLGA